MPATATRDAASISGVTVQADQALTVSLQQPTKLQVIGTVTSRAASALVKPGTTADVYSINAVTQDKASNLGGGGTLNSAWSAITSVPGVFVQPGQNGYIGAGATLSIRGGDYDQIGYELDGIPVNRSFDNYPSSALSSLGQQELQVYTGAVPSNSESEGISGYINQVIRTGTAPASRSLDLGAGAPTFYNKLTFETGGANPARTFSYYVGLGGYNQNFRYNDQYNGAALSQNYGAPIGNCPAGGSAVPSCMGPNGQDYTNGGTTPAIALAPYNYGNAATVIDRDSIVNLHFGLPQKNGNKDDVQVLYDNNHLNNILYDSINDSGGTALLNAACPTAGGATGALPCSPFYPDGYQFNGAPRGTLLPGTYSGGGASQYFYPQSPTGRPFQAPIPPNQRDSFQNDQAVVKVQYQKNFGTNAFLRGYVYSNYSDWLNYGAVEAVGANLIGSTFNIPADYELSSHSRGGSLQFSDQIGQHLVSMQGSYTTSTSLRDNNTEWANGIYGPNTINSRTAVGVLVNPTNYLTTGQCYSYAGAPVSCYNGTGSNFNKNAGYFTLQQAYNNAVVPANTVTCGGVPCQYLVINNGQYATYNTVRPKFWAASITDNWKPTEKLTLNYGLRYDLFQFYGSDTTSSPARQFLFTAFNNAVTSGAIGGGALPLVNTPSQVLSYVEFQPRLGATYTINPTTVLRASYGRYAQAPNSAFEQYDYLQSNSPSSLEPFAKFGVGNTPAHAIRPEVSNNYDFSFEHQFGRDTSIKFSPFLRRTQDQIQQFFLDQATSFVSGLNVGRQTSEGFELEVDKGDFSRNGLAARLSFTYTNSYVNYNSLSNGSSIIDGFNTSIKAYNAYTRAGGGAPCYTTSPDGATPGAAAPTCPAGSIANPYYNAPIAATLDRNANYPTFDTFPGPIGSSYNAFGAPYVATLLVQYKKGPLAITPALQFFAGQRYGAPLTTPGIEPDLCTSGLGGSTTNDPRYPYGAVGGSPYDAPNCSPGALTIPNQYTKMFDGIGAFVAPSSIQLHLQASYDVNKRITLVGNFANIINRCFGGTRVPFAVNHACTYDLVANPLGLAPIGNGYNPGNAIQPILRSPYEPAFPVNPFNMYVEARIKL